MFIKYEKPVKPIKKGKKISINKTGKITFYKTAANDLKDAEYVDLYYDSEKQQIGFHPVSHITMSFNSCKIQGTITKFIICKKFFKRFGILIPVGKYDYTLSNGMLVMQLPESEVKQ